MRTEDNTEKSLGKFFEDLKLNFDHLTDLAKQGPPNLGAGDGQDAVEASPALVQCEATSYGTLVDFGTPRCLLLVVQG